ncbi:hypothetical protein O7606_19825 [Micromonospora sp. WMMD882]|uniref:hypothetical protein n=1 Tax=Micromonospora sp. WMMD882 TaxID=3015151 RepID=UPI00248B32E5|nr:hypothetical protein [Micromonospora sp. WMMD882]WBB78459.1 hypothetical protein O7606_19825 [Micromonospora sp. WMMD882]
MSAGSSAVAVGRRTTMVGVGIRFVVLGFAFTVPAGVFPQRPAVMAGYLLLVAVSCLALEGFRAWAARLTGLAFTLLALGMGLLAAGLVTGDRTRTVLHLAGLAVLAPAAALLNVGLTDLTARRWPGARPVLTMQALLAVGNGVPPIVLGLGAGVGPLLVVGVLTAAAAAVRAPRQTAAAAADGPPAGLVARLAACAGLATAVQLGLVSGAALVVPDHADQALLGAGIGMIVGRIAASLPAGALPRRGVVLLCLVGTGGVAALPMVAGPVAVTVLAVVATAAVAPIFPTLLGLGYAPGGSSRFGAPVIIAASTGVAALAPGALQLAQRLAPGTQHWILPALGLLLAALVSTLPWPRQPAATLGKLHRGDAHVG